MVENKSVENQNTWLSEILNISHKFKRNAYVGNINDVFNTLLADFECMCDQFLKLNNHLSKGGILPVQWEDVETNRSKEKQDLEKLSELLDNKIKEVSKSLEQSPQTKTTQPQPKSTQFQDPSPMDPFVRIVPLEYENFGDKLRHLRDDNLMTVEELSEKSGVSVQAIYTIESGRVKKPRYKTILQLRKVFGNNL